MSLFFASGVALNIATHFFFIWKVLSTGTARGISLGTQVRPHTACFRSMARVHF